MPRAWICIFILLVNLLGEMATKARKYVLRSHFSGLPKREDLEIVEETLPPLKDGGTPSMNCPFITQSAAGSLCCAFAMRRLCAVVPSFVCGCRQHIIPSHIMYIIRSLPKAARSVQLRKITRTAFAFTRI